MFGLALALSVHVFAGASPEVAWSEPTNSTVKWSPRRVQLVAELDALTFQLRTRPDLPGWSKVLVSLGGVVSLLSVLALPAFIVTSALFVSQGVFVVLGIMAVGVAMLTMALAAGLSERTIAQEAYDAKVLRCNEIRGELGRMRLTGEDVVAQAQGPASAASVATF